MKFSLVLLTLSVGIALGVAGTIFAPDVAGPYLPEAFRVKKAETIDGEVVRKLREGERLLLTVQTTQGAILVTFKKKVAEIDLLVQQGDTITLRLSRYEPFVDEPAIERVRKQEPTPRPKASLEGRNRDVSDVRDAGVQTDARHVQA
jgi:TOBE domain-containing protein